MLIPTDLPYYFILNIAIQLAILFSILEPPNALKVHSDHLKCHYKKTRFMQEEWPPDPLKHFTNLALFHHEDAYTEREFIVTHSTVDDRFSTSSQDVSSDNLQEQVKASKDVEEIFAPDEDGEPESTLIEGAPGIGKTVLSKEIAFRWASGILLINKILLFLIFLRDPLVQKIMSLKDLVKYYYRFDESSDAIASSCADYLLQSDGDDIMFIFDGFDEYPENLRQNGFISDILQRKRLPCCHLVVTSRPHASAHLRAKCDRFIEIVGFAKEDRQNYIINSLKNTEDVDELNEYLNDHPIINSLCFIPFNMTVLLWLFRQRVTIPDSSTELYNYFICHTIRHHLYKSKINLSDSFVDLDSLEKPYRQLIQQLSSLSYDALAEGQSTFTLDDIKDLCPQIESSGEINCFGLLQAVQHFGFTNNIVLTFSHLTIQEYLAAYHIRCLSHYEKFCVFKEEFMSDFYGNTFTMYVGMTGGQEPAFQQYLSGYGKVIAYIYGTFGKYAKYLFTINPHSIATYPFNVRCYLRLFRCFYEAGNEESCREITEAIFYFFQGYVLVSEILLPSDVDSLGLFLCSRKEWKGLYFHQCIDDVGIQILHQFLTKRTKSTCIHTICIGSSLMSYSTGGKLTQLSSCLITEIAKRCKTEVLEVFVPVLLLEDVVSLKSQLTRLIFYVDTSQTEIPAFVPVYLCDGKILKVLSSYEIDPNEDSVEAFTEALKHNSVNECSSATVIELKLYRSLETGILKSIARPLHFIYKIKKSLLELTIFVGKIIVLCIIALAIGIYVHRFDSRGQKLV